MTEDVWTLIKMGGCALAAVLVWYAVFCRCRRLDRIDAARRRRLVIVHEEMHPFRGVRKGESCPTDSH